MHYPTRATPLRFRVDGLQQVRPDADNEADLLPFSAGEEGLIGARYVWQGTWFAGNEPVGVLSAQFYRYNRVSPNASVSISTFVDVPPFLWRWELEFPSPEMPWFLDTWTTVPNVVPGIAADLRLTQLSGFQP